MIETLTLPVVFGIFAASALVVAIGGVRLTALADRLADRTGLGEALMGGLLLGMTTSLSGTVVSVTSALEDLPSLAFSNGVGGIGFESAAILAIYAGAILLQARLG